MWYNKFSYGSVLSVNIVFKGGRNVLYRKNRKEVTIITNNSIKKSNELSMAKLNQGLTLNQMQLLAFAIYSTQTNGKTEFQKKEFQDKFGMAHYHTDDAFHDSDKLSSLRFSTSDLEKKKFRFTPMFSDLSYNNGTFKIEWNHKFLPHILELKEKFVVTDLTITSNFRSGFSWILYDYLKAHYGYWNKELSKEAMLNLFAVEDKKTYQKNTNRFKKTVLDVAIEEINKYTELEAWYTETKVGNKITGFILHWSTGKQVSAATEKQRRLFKEISDEIQSNILDYFGLKNEDLLKQARLYINDFREFLTKMDSGEITAETANECIKGVQSCYMQLENLLIKDGQKRDTSIYYNWLEESDELITNS